MLMSTNPLIFTYLPAAIVV